MSQYHRPTSKKVSRGTGGAKTGKFRDKKLSHYGRDFTSTKVSETESRKVVRGRGGNCKIKLKKASYVNVVVSGKAKKARIKGVLESQNSENVRRNIITKGAVLDTDSGKVVVTNRVGQDGIVNGALVKSN